MARQQICRRMLAPTLTLPTLATRLDDVILSLSSIEYAMLAVV